MTVNTVFICIRLHIGREHEFFEHCQRKSGSQSFQDLIVFPAGMMHKTGMTNNVALNLGDNVEVEDMEVSENIEPCRGF